MSLSTLMMYCSAHCDNNIEVKFPIIGDADRKVSTAFGMLDPGTSDEQDLPLTIR
jgi:alkyl hydroperoxide reductase subunit AhpC